MPKLQPQKLDILIMAWLDDAVENELISPADLRPELVTRLMRRLRADDSAAMSSPAAAD